MSEPRESREELEQRIAAYIDGELSPAEAARLEVFLANTDPQLAQQVIGMLADKHRLRALPPVKAPIDLAGRIMEQVERASLLHDSEHFSAPIRPWYQTRAAIAAGILLVVGGFSYFLVTSVFTPGSPWRNPIAHNDVTPAIVTPSPDAAAPPLSAVPATPAAVTPPTAGPTPGEGAIALAPSPKPELRAMEKTGSFGGGGIGGGGGGGGGRFATDDVHMKAADESKDRALAKADTPLIPAPAPAAVTNAPAADLSARAVASKAGPTAGFARAFVNTPKETAEDSVQLDLERNRQLLAAGNDSALKLGYTETDTPQKALAEVTAPAGQIQQKKIAPPEPIVLAFAAHNADDAGRLQTRLAEMIAADNTTAQKQQSLQTRQRDEQSSTSNISNSVSLAPAGGTYRYYNNDAKGFDKDVLESPTPLAVANDNKSENQAAAPIQQQQELAQPGAQQALVPAPQPAPYRVVLRADQLQTLANEFDLRAAARGQTAYAITHTAAVNAAAPALDTGSTLPAQTLAAAGTEHNVATPELNGAATQTRDAERSENYIDCVITIEPAK